MKAQDEFMFVFADECILAAEICARRSHKETSAMRQAKLLYVARMTGAEPAISVNLPSITLNV